MEREHMLLGKYSFGIGDRFGHQGKAQLAAIAQARSAGLDVTPVWNKSYREHNIIGTRPADVRHEADAAVTAGEWEGAYFVDADHIGMGNVDQFLEASDFFTLDVADFIGQVASEADVSAFAARHRALIGAVRIDGIEEAFEVSETNLKSIAGKYLVAVKEAGKIYRHIASSKGEGDFVTEVSMDETDAPQTPVEMLVILAARPIMARFENRFIYFPEATFVALPQHFDIDAEDVWLETHDLSR
ncbi:MAG: tagaturonate epimerase family protein, partial [Anaerolineae bacterium]